MIQSQKNLSSLWHWESDWWQKRTGGKESCQCFSNALTPSPQPKRPLTLPKFSLGEFLGLGSGWLLLTLPWGFQTLIVYRLYLKSLIFDLLSSSYLTSSCLDCHHLSTDLLYIYWGPGPSIQHFNNNANDDMKATVNGCSPHCWSVQKRLYMKHILYVRLTKTHDVATVFVFASEMVKWKLCTIRLAVVSCQWFPHYVNLFYLNTLLHSTSAVPFLSSSWNLYLHTTAPLPTHSFTLHLLINKCVCNKYLLTTYKVPGQDGR